MSSDGTEVLSGKKVANGILDFNFTSSVNHSNCFSLFFFFQIKPLKAFLIYYNTDVVECEILVLQEELASP